MNNIGKIIGYTLSFLEWAVTSNGWDFDERNEYYSDSDIEKLQSRLLELHSDKRKYTDIGLIYDIEEE